MYEYTHGAKCKLVEWNRELIRSHSGLGLQSELSTTAGMR